MNEKGADKLSYSTSRLSLSTIYHGIRALIDTDRGGTTVIFERLDVIHVVRLLHVGRLHEALYVVISCLVLIDAVEFLLGLRSNPLEDLIGQPRVVYLTQTSSLVVTRWSLVVGVELTVNLNTDGSRRTTGARFLGCRTTVD